MAAKKKPTKMNSAQADMFTPQKKKHIEPPKAEAPKPKQLQQETLFDVPAAKTVYIPIKELPKKVKPYINSNSIGIGNGNDFGDYITHGRGNSVGNWKDKIKN